ncbi:MAG: tetratricopeptide repeat protein [Myxococcales bacterium]
MTNTSTDTGHTTQQSTPDADPGGGLLKLSNYLGILRDDPDDADALRGLERLVTERDEARLGEQPVRLLEMARGSHERLGELDAVAHLIEVEAQLIDDDPSFAASLWKELGRLRAENLLDPEGAQEAYARAQELAPEDNDIIEAVKRIDQSKKSWRKFSKRFIDEAQSATDTALKTSLLQRAASLVWQYKKKGRDSETDKLFKAAIEADPGNAKAVMLYEQTLRAREKWEQLVELLLDAADNATDSDAQLGCYVRAARVCLQKLDDRSRAAACYERVLDIKPAHDRAMAFLSEHFASEERWDDLVGMYEQALSVRHKLDVEVGILLQIGMVHWRMRGEPAAAEPYFARLRKLDAAHPAVLDFYREFYGGDDARDERWMAILADAQRVAGDEAKLRLALEHARLALNGGDSAEAGIDAWKIVQRLDPGNAEATAALKTLYRRAEKWNALADVIKAEVEALGGYGQGEDGKAASAEVVQQRVALLRELLAIYRDRLHMDGMVINTLGRIIKLVPGDRDTLAELASRYESAGRWNDLINVLTEDAEAIDDRAQKVDAYLRVANLWIERFGNFNQAAGPLEKVLELDPDNREALLQLKSIYEKKRAWKPLFEVLRKERGVASDPSVRLANTIEMARLAADRLHSYAEAIALWRDALEQDPRAPGATDALEKLTEREQDWGGLVDVLERELSAADDDESRIRVLQKLAALHAERLEDPAGAVRCWRRILEIDPKHGRALRAIRDGLVQAGDWDAVEALYREVSDFEGLVDVLTHEADAAQDPGLRVELSFRAARIYEQDIGEAVRAVRSYERVLAVDPKNQTAAERLAPIYEADEKWSRLRAMLDLQLDGLGDHEAERKLELLKRLESLCRDQLRDGEAAFSYAAAAYALDPASERSRAALESAAEAAVAYERVTDLYRKRADAVGGDEAVTLRRRVAELALDRLSQTDLAIEESRKVLQEHPADAQVMDTLERLYRSEQRVVDLHSLLEHRLEQDPSVEERWETLRELAQLEEEKFEDPNAAARRLRAMSEIDPGDRDTLLTRDRLALAAERWEELDEILALRLEVEQEPAARVELASRRGLVKLDHLGQLEAALDAFEQVLQSEPLHHTTVAALERMHDAPSADESSDESNDERAALRRRVQLMLERVYDVGARFDKLHAILSERLETEKDEEEVRRLRLRLAEVSGTKLGDDAGAYGSLEAAFFEQPTDEDLWDRLAEVAERAGHHRALANAYATAIEAGDLSEEACLQLSRRAARIYDEVIGQPEEAEPFHQRILQLDPLDDTSFLSLKELYTGAERWDELQALYRTRIEETSDLQSRLDLLLQLCFLFEEILERPEAAIDSYRQVLELAPDHGAARRTLERLYEQTERWRDLAELLRGNLDRAEGQERVDLMLRLGDLCENKLGRPGEAVDHFEGVLTEQPHQLRAQEALGRLLGVESQRQRVATILEPLYESQGAYGDLARVLEIQLDDADTEGGRADLLLRIGELHEQRTRDAEAAFSAFARAVEAEPDNGLARESLARVASARETFRQERAQVLRRVLDRLDDRPDLESDILLELAVLLDEYLEDKDGAERTYERLIEIDGDNPDVVLTASRALERIHIEREDWGKLVKDLDRQAELETDDGTRVALLVRLAEVYEDMLDRVDGAIDAHCRRLEIDGADLDAMRSLERLYERTQRYEELVEVLRRHAEVEEDESEQRALGRRAAAIREGHLADVEGAIEAYADVVQSFGPDVTTLAALAELQERAERWDDLLETLRTQEELTEDAADRAVLQFRMAEAMRLHTADVERALEYYELVLDFEPTHAGALAALDVLMSSDDARLRSDAARIAAPFHEASGSFERLLGVLEVQQQTDDPADKLAALRRAAEVAENGLDDSSRAFEYAGRALVAGADDPTAPELVTELARLADLSERYSGYVTVLREAAPQILDGDLLPEVYRRIGEVARDRLHDVELAIEYFGKLLEERPDDRDALDALEQLDEEAGNHAALIEVLGRKAELETDPDARAALLARKADVLERRLDDSEAAIEVLEELVIDHPSLESYQALERLYSSTGRFGDLGAAYEAELDRGIGEAVELRFRLADNCHQHLGETERALDFLRDALAEQPDHGPSIALLEGLLAEDSELRAQVAEILEPVYLSNQQWGKLTSVLEARAAAEDILDEKKRLLVRLAQIHEDQLEDFDSALEVYARLFEEDPRDEETWETLTRLAKVGEQWKRLGKILRRPFRGIDGDGGVEDEEMARLAKYAGRIYVERIGNHHEAADLYARALAFDPTDREAFEALERAYLQLGANDRLLPLYRDQADSADSDERRVSLLHRRARIFEAQSQPETHTETHTEARVGEQAGEALATYREILEIDPDDAPAIEGVERLLTAAEDWHALAEHLRARIDQCLGSPSEVPLRLRLAELLEGRLQDVEGAIDAYEEIAQIDPKEHQTIWALERLVQQPEHTLRICQILEPIYRQLDQWKKLVAIFEAQVAILEDPIDQVRLLSEIGELHEARGADVALAFRAWMRAFRLEPENGVARGHVDRLAAQMGAWDEHVQAYESTLERTEDPLLKSELLTTIARVHDEKRGDPRAAIAAYERLADHDPEDPTPLDSLEALLTMVGDWEGMARLLERRAEQAFDVDERTELLRRLASVHEELLGDREAAISALLRAVEEDDTDPLAYEGLDRLYSIEQRPEELSRVLSRRIELATDPGERVAMGLRLGVLHERELHQPGKAIETYQRVLDDEPTNAPALAALGGLYDREARFTELLDNLSERTALAPDDAERVRLLEKAGDVLERQLNDVFEAIERYRQVLEIDPTRGGAIDALLRIARVPDYRVQASEIVEPLLRAQERWDDLVELMEGGLSSIDDALDRRTELMRLAEVHEHGRGQPADAFAALCRAMAIDPTDDNLLADAERLARDQGKWRELVDVLFACAPQVPDPVLGAELFRRAGRIGEQEMGDDARAIEAFVAASEQDDDATETLADLDRLYQKTGRLEELLDVVERRIAASIDPEDRTELLIRLGDLREQHFDDGRGAFVAFKEVLEGDPANTRALEGMERLGRRDALAQDVLDTLDDCYRQTGALDKVAGLYDIRIRLAETDAERVRLLREAMGVWENELGNSARALEHARRVFEIDPDDEGALAEVERLADAAGSYEPLRGMVEGLVEAGAVEGQRKKDLCLRAADWYRERLEDAAAEERCLRWVLEVDPEMKEIHERLVGLLREPGRERELVAALREWSEVEHDSSVRVERMREAARIAESAGDRNTAGECYATLLGTDPDDHDALSQLARIRAEQEQLSEEVELRQRLLRLADDVEQRTALRHRIAQVLAGPLDEPAQAIDLLRELLAEAPHHAEAMGELDALYQRTERFEELRELLESQLQHTEEPEARVELRVRLARLSEAQLGDRARAIAELEGILQERPDHALALDELERLYTADERWEQLAALLERRAGQAAEAGDPQGEIALLHRLAELVEQRLQDPARATEVYARIHERAPSDRGALDALIRLSEAAENWGEVVRHSQALLSTLTGEEAVAVCHRIAEIADERIGAFDAAEQALLEALQRAPGHAETRQKLEALYERHEAHAKLAELLAEQEPEAQDPQVRVALLNRIATLYRDALGDAASAVQYLERAVQLVPDDREALLSLCDLYIAADRQRDAIPVLEKLIESYGGRRAKEVAVYQHKLGQAYEGAGEVEEALARYDAAFKIDLTNVHILRDLGRLCLEKGDLERAQKSFRALLLQKLGPDSGIEKADVYYRLGEISFRQGDKVKAKAMLERAVGERGEHAEAQALLDQL